MVKDSTENSETVPNFGLGISYMDSMQYALSRYALCMHLDYYQTSQRKAGK